MANANTPFGLRPAFMLDGSPYNGHAIRCVHASGDGTGIYLGDPVKIAGDGINGWPTVIRAAAGDEIFGVAVGFEPLRTNLETMYCVASTEREILVVPALDVMFEIQEDSAGNNLALTDIGNDADIVVANGVAATGISGVMLDSSTAPTGDSSGGTLLILGLVQKPDNAVGTNAKWLVRINESSLRGDGTAI